MKAVVCTSYGSPEVLSIQERPVPTPKHGQVLCQVLATAANSGDARIRRADPWVIRLLFGWKRPRREILGNVYSGRVVGLGPGVQSLELGDEIFGSTGMQFGCMAEYITVDLSGALSHKPHALGHEQAAALVFGGTTAYSFVQRAQIQPGSQVLIYGAAGAVGLAAVQWAKILGANVTAVCSSAKKELVLSYGADQVLAYDSEAFELQPASFDIVWDTVNAVSPKNLAKATRRGGQLILSACGASTALQGLFWARVYGCRMVAGVAQVDGPAVRALATTAIEKGLRAHISASMPLEQIHQAHSIVDSGRKSGALILRLHS